MMCLFAECRSFPFMLSYHAIMVSSHMDEGINEKGSKTKRGQTEDKLQLDI